MGGKTFSEGFSLWDWIILEVLDPGASSFPKPTPLSQNQPLYPKTNPIFPKPTPLSQNQPLYPKTNPFFPKIILFFPNQSLFPKETLPIPPPNRGSPSPGGGSRDFSLPPAFPAGIPFPSRGPGAGNSAGILPGFCPEHPKFLPERERASRGRRQKGELRVRLSSIPFPIPAGIRGSSGSQTIREEPSRAVKFPGSRWIPG